MRNDGGFDEGAEDDTKLGSSFRSHDESSEKLREVVWIGESYKDDDDGVQSR